MKIKVPKHIIYQENEYRLLLWFYERNGIHVWSARYECMKSINANIAPAYWTNKSLKVVEDNIFDWLEKNNAQDAD